MIVNDVELLVILFELHGACVWKISARKPNQGHARPNIPSILESSFFTLLLAPFIPSEADRCLDHESLDFVLESTDLAHEVGSLVGGDGGSDDGAGDTASATKSHLGGNVAAEKVSLCSYRGV